MAEPWEDDYGVSPPGSGREFSDFEPGELFHRGRSPRVVCRCVNRSLSCGHQHTENDETTCRKPRGSHKHVCCECGGSAYTPSDNPPSNRRYSGEYENPSGSRSSSEERKRETLEQLLSATPKREAFFDILNNRGIDNVNRLLLDPAKYEEDPDKYLRDLLGNPDEGVREVVDEAVEQPSNIPPSRWGNERRS